MKLYQHLTENKITNKKDAVVILQSIGIDNEFSWFIAHPDFLNFLHYFIHSYSLESTIMDTSCFVESLLIVEKKFNFSLEDFKRECGDDFDKKYFKLITFYLRVQRNRDYKTLMIGNLLYEKMSAASTFYLKKEDEDSEVDSEVDFKIAYQNFLNSVELSKQLKVLEDVNKKIIGIGEIVDENSELKSKFELRMEEVLPGKLYPKL